MRTSYHTISGASEGFLKEKNSKFYAYAFPVRSEEDIKTELSLLRELYPDATHHCYAWMLGIDKVSERANDDGEPSSSAGKPILRQIYSKDITNVLVVVVRFYGGKKLGVPGLIYAYGESAKLALENATVVEKKVMVQFRASCPFGEEKHIYRIAKRLGASMKPEHSMTEFATRLEIELEKADDFASAFKELHKIELERD